MTITAKIIADSVSPIGKRITTMELRYPRFIHAQFMTHRVFSRNTSSSRAIPVEKIIQRITDDPAEPIYWGKNQKGMKAEEELTTEDRETARMLWHEAKLNAIDIAEQMTDLGLHKQHVNRILEPWSHISVVCTATEWENFYALRTSEDAQPEIHMLAQQMLAEHQKSVPVERLLHVPYVKEQEMKDFSRGECIMMSVARCARVSYLNHDNSEPDPLKDFAFHDRLLDNKHMSPFEHQAFATDKLNYVSGNFRGWYQYRKTIPNEYSHFDGLYEASGTP